MISAPGKFTRTKAYTLHTVSDARLWHESAAATYAERRRSVLD
jgi:hypothetical protein